MKKDYTDILIILDRSGSMAGREQDVIGGFNRLIEDQKKVPGTATLSLIQFDHDYEPNYLAKDLEHVLPLMKGQYAPRGSTALLDAIGRTMTEAGARLKALSEAARPDKVVLMIFTDGHENASKDFDYPKVKAMIQHQKDHYKWEIVFVGGDLDAVVEGEKLGLNRASTLSYNNTTGGTAAATGSVSDNLANYRSGNKQDMSWTEDEQAQVKAVK